MKLIKRFTLLLLISFFCTYVSAQTTREKIDSIFLNAHLQSTFCGRALVVKNDAVIYNGGYGYANEEWKVEHTYETKFKIGSCTKQFTAALVMLLAEEDKICLDSNICTYIPDYPKSNGHKITIHHLLSHSSGIPDYFFLPQVQSLIYKENKPSEFVKTFWDLPLEFEPGSSAKYSNSGYFILGYIVENITGKTYSEVLQEKIFKPLKMNNTGVDNQHEIFSNKAFGYISVNQQLLVAPYLNSSGAYAAGAIYSSCEDLSKWCQSLLDETLLSPESISKMTSLHNARYGYGFGVLNLNINGESSKIFGHEGEIFGYRSLIHMIPGDNTYIIILDNHNNTKHFGMSKEILTLL